MKKPIDYQPGMSFPAAQRSTLDGTIEYVVTHAVWVCGFLIPEGFVFDGNSAPRPLFWLIARDDCLAAACVHDYIYRGPGQELLQKAGCRVKNLRISADAIWLYVHLSNGTGRWRATFGYMGLRLFGWANFKKVAPMVALCLCFLAACQSRGRVQRDDVPPVDTSVESAGNALVAVDRDLDAIDEDCKALGKTLPKESIKWVQGIQKKVTTAKASTAKVMKDGLVIVEGVKTRDAVIVKETERANKAQAALDSRARNRLEWLISLLGIGCWVVAGYIIWKEYSSGALMTLLGGGVKSVARKLTFVAGLFVFGCFCFWAAVTFDDIIYIGKCAAATVVALVGAGTGWHLLRHRNARKRAEAFEHKMAASTEFGSKGGMDYANPDLLKRAAKELDPLAFKKFEERVTAILSNIK